jgi:hypothetical protein
MAAHLAVNQRSPDIGGSIPSRPTLRVTPDWWGTGLLPRKRLGSRPRARTTQHNMSTWSNGEDAGLRNRRLQVRPLPPTPFRRSSVDESTAFRRRGSHVRVVPAKQPLSLVNFDARSSNGRTSDCYSDYGGSSPPLAARCCDVPELLRVRLSQPRRRGCGHLVANFGQSVLSGIRRRGPEGRTLGQYPRGSRFDSDRRLCLFVARSEGSFTC